MLFGFRTPATVYSSCKNTSGSQPGLVRRVLSVCFNFLLKRESISFFPVHSSDVLGALKTGQLSGGAHSVVRQYAGRSSLTPLLSCDYFSLPTAFGEGQHQETSPCHG